MLTVENIVFNEPPMAVKAGIAATDTNAAIRPYSIAVARSWFTSALTIRSSLLPGDDGATLFTAQFFDAASGAECANGFQQFKLVKPKLAEQLR